MWCVLHYEKVDVKGLIDGRTMNSLCGFHVLLIPRLLWRYSKCPKECEIIPRAQPEGLSHIPEGVCRTPAVDVHIAIDYRAYVTLR